MKMKMEEKIMENNIKKLEEIIEELREQEVQRIGYDEDNKEYIFNISQFDRFFGKYKNLLTFNKNKKDEYMYQIVNPKDVKDKIKIRIIPQIHVEKKNDIKIKTIKKAIFNLKLIYHIDKSGNKEYRIFISYDENGKLKRYRIKSKKMKEIEKDLNKSLEYLNELSNLSFEEFKKII